jgi:hypothetical protein
MENRGSSTAPSGLRAALVATAVALIVAAYSVAGAATEPAVVTAGATTTTTAAPPTIVAIKQFPVQGTCYFTDTWGAPRSGGRRHEGVDIIAKAGLYVYAVDDGTLTKQYIDAPGALAGNGWRLTRADGTYFFYAHFSAFAPGLTVGSSVKAGQIIGNIGMTGNAGSPHLHFEVHPRGGAAINPTPTVRAIDGCASAVVPPQPTTGAPTTVSATTAPATTVPATTVPATTVPATTAPATTVAATTVPATTVPAGVSDKWFFVAAVQAFDTAGGKLAVGTTKRVKVAGLAGVPSGTPGVMLRVAARNVARSGYVTVFPCDAAMPATSTLNIAPNRLNATTALVKVVAGEVCIAANVATDVRVDVIGVLAPAGVGVQPVVARRAMDTRASTPLAANGTRAASLKALGIPAGSKAVTVTVTLLSPVAAGSIGVGPCGGTPWIMPFAAVPAQVFSGVIRTNDAGVCVSSTAQVHVVLDVTAAWTGTKPMTPVAPIRLFDSRSSGMITPAGQSVTLAVPGGAGRAQVSVVVVGGAVGAAVFAWNCAEQRPAASVGSTSAAASTSSTVTLNVTGGSVCLAATSGVHVVIDLMAAG